MCHRIARTIIGLTLVFAVAVPVAWADLERAGPVNAAHGFPEWYQDTTGLAFELGTPLNQAELDGGWNLLLPIDVPLGTAPETFPANWSGEHFYWSAEALMSYTTPPPDTTGRALLVLALESAFNSDTVVAGDQAVFGRLRIRVEPLPASGTYQVFTPYGNYTFPGLVAGDRLFFSSDIGLGAGFDVALTSDIGPFLVPSATPGGAELAAVAGPVPGKLYLCDPAREGPVTGSPIGQNLFRVEGPDGFVLETSNFAVTGRLFTGTIPGNMTVDRASYTRTALGQKVDVYATATESISGRLPGSVQQVNTPALSFFNAPPETDPVTGLLTVPAGQTPMAMFRVGTKFWGQSQPAELPTGVTVQDAASRDATGLIVPTVLGANLVDEVTVTSAIFDPANGGMLTVAAVSSDEVVLPTLTLVGFGAMTDGQIMVMPLVAPPSKVRVLSSGGGVGELEVTVLPVGP